MQIILSLLALSSFFISGCAKVDAGPEMTANSIKLSKGQSIAADSVSQTNSKEHLRLSAPQDGIMFVQTTVFPARDDISDASGIRKIYLFVPDRFVVAAKEGKMVSISRTDGLLAMEYSKNDAFPEKYCFQQLSAGTISLRAEGSRNEMVIESLLKTLPVSGEINARCDVSEFVSTTAFPLPPEVS